MTSNFSPSNAITLLIQEDDLHRLKLLGKFSSGDISVDIEDLAVRRLSQAGKNGQCTCSDGCLDGTLIDTSDVSDKVVLVFVEIVGGEYARGDRAGPSN